MYNADERFYLEEFSRVSPVPFPGKVKGKKMKQKKKESADFRDLGLPSIWQRNVQREIEKKTVFYNKMYKKRKRIAWSNS